MAYPPDSTLNRDSTRLRGWLQTVADAICSERKDAGLKGPRYKNRTSQKGTRREAMHAEPGMPR